MLISHTTIVNNNSIRIEIDSETVDQLKENKLDVFAGDVDHKSSINIDSELLSTISDEGVNISNCHCGQLNRHHDRFVGPESHRDSLDQRPQRAPASTHNL